MSHVQNIELLNLRKSIAINCLIMFLWWIAFNPGFFSADSFAVLNMARNQQLNSLWTAPWAIFIEKITLSGSHPEFGTLLISLIFATSVAIFSNSVAKNRSAVLISAILTFTPTVGAMGITLWHDIPMTAGFLLILSAVKNSRYSYKIYFLLLFFGLILSSFRHNGLPAILIWLVLMLIFGNYRKFLVASILLTIILITASSLLNQVYAAENSTGRSAYIGWMRNDISCYLSKGNDAGFLEKFYGEKVKASDWTSSSACTWFNDATNASDYSSDLEGEVPSSWFELLKEDPKFILTTHAKRHAYLLPLPIYGSPRVPFIHTTIEFPDQGVQFANPNISEKLRNYPRIWNFFNYIFGYAGIWLAITFILANRRRNRFYFEVGLLGLVQSIGFFVVADIPDGRYMLLTLVTGQFIFLFEVFPFFKSHLTKLSRSIRSFN